MINMNPSTGKFNEEDVVVTEEDRKEHERSYKALISLTESSTEEEYKLSGSDIGILSALATEIVTHVQGDEILRAADFVRLGVMYGIQLGRKNPLKDNGDDK